MMWRSSTDEGENENESSRSSSNKDADPGIMQVIANSNNSMTSTLHCSRVILKPATRTEMQVSTGVEVYYILHGIGNFTIQGTGAETTQIKADEYFIINPWKARYIENHGANDLVFLKITDSVRESKSNEINITVESIDGVNTIQTITDGIVNSFRKLTTSNNAN